MMTGSAGKNDSRNFFAWRAVSEARILAHGERTFTPELLRSRLRNDMRELALWLIRTHTDRLGIVFPGGEGKGGLFDCSRAVLKEVCTPSIP